MSLKEAVTKRAGRTSTQKEAAVAEAGREPVKRLNVNLPESVLKRFKAQAAMEGKDMSELVKGWIETYLK